MRILAALTKPAVLKAGAIALLILDTARMAYGLTRRYKGIRRPPRWHR